MFTMLEIKTEKIFGITTDSLHVNINNIFMKSDWFFKV